jgi:hypothetical protein
LVLAEASEVGARAETGNEYNDMILTAFQGWQPLENSVPSNGHNRITSVEPFHLFRYLDEQSYRFNNRATKDNPLNDADRFMLACSQILRQAPDLG